MTVREQLRDAYLRSGLTQTEIAVRAGVHENTVYRILAGQNTRADALLAVAMTLRIDAIHLAAPPD